MNIVTSLVQAWFGVEEYHERASGLLLDILPRTQLIAGKVRGLPTAV